MEIAPAAAPPVAATPPTEPAAAPPVVDHVPELVRVAKAERKAAEAIKAAEATTAELSAFKGKQAQFDKLVSDGDMLSAARLVFPNDDAKVDKLFLQLTAYVADREDPRPLTVDEQIKAALAAEKAEAKKAADALAEEAKKTKNAEADAHLDRLRGQYFGEARKVLAANPGAYPLVTAEILSGDIAQADIVAAVEGIGADLAKLNLPAAEFQARLDAETTPAAIFAALEQVLRTEKGLPEPGAAPAGEQTLDQITAAAVSAIEKRRPMSISASSLQGAAPVVHKQPGEMSLDELNAYAIAEAEKKHRRAAG